MKPRKKLKELIKSLDPSFLQCYVCKKWFNEKENPINYSSIKREKNCLKCICNIVGQKMKVPPLKFINYKT